jgi:hypothetical protein
MEVAKGNELYKYESRKSFKIESFLFKNPLNIERKIMSEGDALELMKQKWFGFVGSKDAKSGPPKRKKINKILATAKKSKGKH